MMKRIYSVLFILILATSLSVSAAAMSENSFESWVTDSPALSAYGDQVIRTVK